MSGRPASGCSTFGTRERMRVPWPAARTMASGAVRMVDTWRDGRCGRFGASTAVDGRWAGPDATDDPSPALEVAGIRAGSTPGTHLVTWDGPGESVELRLSARDRQAYADGALAACRWLVREDRGPGLHPFDAVVDELLGTAPVRATAMASAWPL